MTNLLLIGGLLHILIFAMVFGADEDEDRCMTDLEICGGDNECCSGYVCEYDDDVEDEICIEKSKSKESDDDEEEEEEDDSKTGRKMISGAGWGRVEKTEPEPVSNPNDDYDDDDYNNVDEEDEDEDYKDDDYWDDDDSDDDDWNQRVPNQDPSLSAPQPYMPSQYPSPSAPQPYTPSQYTSHNAAKPRIPEWLEKARAAGVFLSPNLSNRYQK